MTEHSIHERLRQALTQIGWSQERLGREIHSNPATISRWLNGKIPPSRTTLQRIAHATKVNAQWLLTGEGEMRAVGGVAASSAESGEILQMASRVLDSRSEYRHVLAANIRAFYQALRSEEEMKDVKQEVVALRSEIAELKGMMLSLGRGGLPPTQATP